MRAIIQFLLFSSATCLSASSLFAQTGISLADHRPAIAATTQVPLSFEQATSGDARWTARGNGYKLALGAADIQVGLNNEQLRILFVGADAKAESSGLDPLPGKVNYFVGRDPKAWRHDIPTYGRVQYKAVYPGVDLLWYGKQGRLEYDLDLQPGADPNKIAMRFEGARKLALEANGDLRVDMASGSLSLKLPGVYQDSDKGRTRITTSYDLRAANEVGFHLAAYDKSRPLVIDPTLVYATYFGSGGLLSVTAAAVDSSGNIYMGGSAYYSVVPTVNAYQPGALGQTNAFIAKFDPTGKTILYSTYVGGSNTDHLYGIAVDSTSGDLVGVGQTFSPDFPVVNPIQSAPGPNGEQAAFTFRLAAAGNQLVYSTYLGGTVNAGAYAVALDASANAYVTGYGRAFPTQSPALNDCCVFVEKLSNTGSQVYAAQMAGGQGKAIAVDSSGAAYVAGTSYVSSFPNNPPGAQKANAGGGGDAFVAKLSPDATSLVWATFLGGTGPDTANSIALGAGNVVYVGGQTASTDFPVTAGVVQGTFSGGTDAFVAELSADGSSFGWVTYLGGSQSDILASLAVGSGGLVVAGSTYSRDFPIANALEPAFPGSPSTFFKSTDSGASFAPADSGLLSALGGTILPDPSSAGTIVIDTTQGVYRSADDGATWANVRPNSLGSTSTDRSVSNPAVLYSADNCSLNKSIDGGQTWNAAYTNCTGFSYLVAISPADPNIVLLFDGETTELRSTNGGVTFPQTLTTPFPSGLYKFRIVASPDGSMYADSGYQGLYKSTDSGLTWTQLGAGVLPSYFPGGFTLSASSPSILYVADGTNVYKSTNAGTSWTTVGAGAGVQYLAAAPSNAQIIYGISTANNGILISTNGGAIWTAAGFVDSPSIQSLSVSPLNSAEIYVGDNLPQSGFVSKLSTDGTTLLWSTYYGSYGQPLGYNIPVAAAAALAPSGNVWVAGSVNSASLPLTPDARNANAYASNPAFLAEIADATASCAYTINPATQYSYYAGWLVFSVTAPSGCAWTATPSDTWIHVVRSSGTGSGTIPLAVDANTTASTRNGTVTVNGQVYTIVQPSGSCTYQVTNPALTSGGGTASITVTAPAGCPWDVELQNSDPAAVTSPSTGTGDGSVTVSVPPNPSNAYSASYAVQIGGSPSSVYVDAATCVYTLQEYSNTVFLSADTQQYSFSISANCSWTASTDQPGWLTLNRTSGNGPGFIGFTVLLNNTGVDRVAHITVGTLQFTVTQNFISAQFADVPPSASYFDAANLMFLAGVTTGCVTSSDPSTRMYCPDDSVTREEMAAFIVRAVTGTTTPAIYNAVPYFTDVPTTNPFFPHIQKMEELGITTGCGTGVFCPTATIPRWEMAMFMVRARLMLQGAAFTTATTPYFADVPTNVEGNGIPFPFIQRSYEENITAGCGTNPLIYCPDALVTRGEMASFIMRALFNETMVVGPTAPLLNGVAPNTMAATPGTQITVTITGINTNFQAGDTVTIPSGWLAVSNLVVNSATSISATLTANANVAPGPQALVVTTGGQNLTLPLAIQVGTY